MRIPHHLSRSSSGRWSFVQRVPVDLQAVLDCRLIKRTLKTISSPACFCLGETASNGPVGSLTAALKFEEEARSRHVSFPVDWHGIGLDKRQHSISYRGRDAKREINLPGPAATEHCRPHDEPAGLNALNLGRATAVFDNPVWAHLWPSGYRDLSQSHRAFSLILRSRTNCRASYKGYGRHCSKCLDPHARDRRTFWLIDLHA